MQDIRSYNLIELGQKVLSLLMLGGVVLLHAVTVESIYLSGLISLAIGFIWTLRRLKTRLFPFLSPSVSLFKENLHYGMKAYVAALFSFLVLRIDLLMIQYMRGAEETGFYSIAAAVADLVYLLPVIVGTILFPRLSAMSSDQERWDFARVIARWVGLMMLFIGSCWPCRRASGRFSTAQLSTCSPGINLVDARDRDAFDQCHLYELFCIDGYATHHGLFTRSSSRPECPAQHQIDPFPGNRRRLDRLNGCLRDDACDQSGLPGESEVGSMRSIPFQQFKKIYEEKVESIYKHWTREMQTEMSFHCYGWNPEVFNIRTYLEASVIRYYTAYCALCRRKKVRRSATTGGFWGALPIACVSWDARLP
jgi:hypothetical protein